MSAEARANGRSSSVLAVSVLEQEIVAEFEQEEKTKFSLLDTRRPVLFSKLHI